VSPRGGYQEPSHPAAVSGPGALSQRTDGSGPQGAKDIPDAKYGEQKQFHDIEGGAPMQGGGSAPPPPVPFDGDTQRPDEPVTAGAAAGPGPGPAAAGIQPDLAQDDYNNMKSLIPGLELIANQPQANPSTRALLRHLKSLGS
jgi:hypothetical protein